MTRLTPRCRKLDFQALVFLDVPLRLHAVTRICCACLTMIVIAGK